MSSEHAKNKITRLLEIWGVYHINRYLNSSHRPLAGFFSNNARSAAAISFIIGFSAALITAMADIFFLPKLLTDYYNVIVILVCINLAVVFIEFWMLFHISFQVIAKYISDINKQECLNNEVKQSLVRAVLELDEPKIMSFGLNPYRYQNKHYWLMLIAYKIKVIISNFAAKIIVRKLLSRIGLRSYAPLISTIITGWWDLWVQNRVLKEVRFRLHGRLAVLKLCDDLKTNDYSSHYIETFIRITAVRTELFGCYNINMDYILNQLNLIYKGTITDIHGLYHPELMADAFNQCTEKQQKDLSEMSVILLSLKRGKLLAKENEFMKTLNIKKNQLMEKKESYNTY